MASRNLWITQWSYDDETGLLTGKGSEAAPDGADVMEWSASGPFPTFVISIPADVVWTNPQIVDQL